MASEHSEDNDMEKIEQSLRSLVIKVFKYYEKYDIQEKYLEVFEEAIEKCEDFIEVIEVIKEMIGTLMNHVHTITSEFMDFSECSQDRNGRNIKDTIKNYETEIKRYTKVVVEQKNYIQILENRIKDKDTLYLQVVSENKVPFSHQKLKSELKLLQDWGKGESKKLRDSTQISSANNTIIKNLKKTTSAKIFKGSDLEVSSHSIKLKVWTIHLERKVTEGDNQREHNR